MNIIVTVITAVFNDEKYIYESVTSILNQTFKDFEYIIVNDGSTDNTLKILEEIAANDKRVTVITQKKSGAATARNTALQQAKGAYVALQDSDDISAPDRLETQFAQLVKAPKTLISCTSFNVIDSDGNIITSNNKKYKDINQNILNGNCCVCHASIMVLKELLMDVKCYNPFYEKTEDYDLIFRLLENKAHFEKINSCLYNYRLRENSESGINDGSYAKRAYQNHKNRINNRPENFEEVVCKIINQKNVLVARKANELFFSEDYSRYIKFYLKSFYKLPVKGYLPYFIFATFPARLKFFLKRSLLAIKNYNRKI